MKILLAVMPLRGASGSKGSLGANFFFCQLNHLHVATLRCQECML